jgi:Phosphotransferase enzyme family
VEPESSLTGGRVTPGVVRVDDTVRRPTGAHSGFVHELLAKLAEGGYEGSPRFHGLDEKGREVLDYRVGWVPPNLEWRRWGDSQVCSAAALVRGLHDATAGSALAGSSEVVCHGDLSPCNFVFVRNEPHYLIDFDRAHPDSRRSDLAYMAWMWLIGPEDRAKSTPLGDRLRQTRLMLDRYGLKDRAGFAAAMLLEQAEVLESAERLGNAQGATWVCGEMAFVRNHVDEIDFSVNA